MNGLDLGLGALEQDMWRVVFLMTRLGAALLAAPFFGATSVPMSVRVSITGALAIFVSVWMPEIATPPALLSLDVLFEVRAPPGPCAARPARAHPRGRCCRSASGRTRR